MKPCTLVEKSQNYLLLLMTYYATLTDYNSPVSSPEELNQVYLKGENVFLIYFLVKILVLKPVSTQTFYAIKYYF